MQFRRIRTRWRASGSRITASNELSAQIGPNTPSPNRVSIATARLVARARSDRSGPSDPPLTVPGTGVLIDGFVADPLRSPFEAQSSGDLLWCPARLQLIDHGGSQRWMTHHLAQIRAAISREAMIAYGIIPREMLKLGLNKPIAAQLAKYRRAMAAEPQRDLGHRHFRVTPMRDLAALLEVKMQIRGRHENSSLLQDADLTPKSQFRPEAPHAIRKFS